MKVLYDHQMFLIQKYGGITKYFCELIQHLGKETKFELSLLYSENQHLKDNYNFFKKKYIPLSFHSSRFSGYAQEYSYKLNSYYSKNKIRRNNFDLFHPTFYDNYFLKYLKKPFIVTVHDMTEFKYKDQYKQYSRVDDMAKVIKKANRIIAISQNTKQDIIDFLDINPDKIDVVYHGYKKPLYKPTLNKFGRYILFVGAREGYKNFISFAKAFALLKVKDKELKLICTGRPFLKGELEFLNSLNILSNVIHKSVNEEELAALYSNALCFVYPSKHEGFGMPILEAFANNCPVCLGRNSSLPEVAGDAGVYFENDDFHSIYATIEKVLNDKEYSDSMKEKGKERLQYFSWQRCAEQTTLSYKKTL